MADRLRPLTTGETELLRTVFADRIDYDAVRLSDGYGLSYVAAVALRQPHADAITLRRTVYFGGFYSEDYAAATPHTQALLVHEMTHIRQWADYGVAGFLKRYARDFAACGGNAKAMYRYAPREPFAAARLEAQAQMVQDYYVAHAYGRPLADLEASLKGSGTYGF